MMMLTKTRHESHENTKNAKTQKHENTSTRHDAASPVIICISHFPCHATRLLMLLLLLLLLLLLQVHMHIAVPHNARVQMQGGGARMRQIAESLHMCVCV